MPSISMLPDPFKSSPEGCLDEGEVAEPMLDDVSDPRKVFTKGGRDALDIGLSEDERRDCCCWGPDGGRREFAAGRISEVCTNPMIQDEVRTCGKRDK